MTVTARPVRLLDIDRVLQDSSDPAHAGPAAPIRAWRDELTLALDLLDYAETILGSDVEILRHALDKPTSGTRSLVADLPRVLAARPWDDGGSVLSGIDTASEMREDWEESDVFTRSDLLMSTHQHMAFTDLGSRQDVRRVLRSILEQLASLALRREAVEDRLQEIRAAIIQQYRDGEVSIEDWLG